MSLCVSCRRPLVPSARFCGACGVAQALKPPVLAEAADRRCARCGLYLGPGSHHCGGCGADAGAPSPAVAGPQPPGGARSESPVAPLASSSGPAWRELLEPPVLYVLSPAHARLSAVIAEACADHVHEVLITANVDDVQDRVAALRNEGRLPLAVCLVGPDEDLPHCSFADETEHDDAVLTDNDWGMEEPVEDEDRDQSCLPAVPVTRIPTTDPALVRRLLAVRDGLPARWDGGLAVSAAVWKRASAAVLAHIAPVGAPPLHTSPELDDAKVRTLLGAKVGRLYFNVHGSDQDTSWVGDGGGEYPRVLRPRSLVVARDAVLVSEACYGARHDHPDTMALRFLAAGGSAFVGSTIIAWGPSAPPSSLADLIAAGVYAALDQGMVLGDALHHSRQTIWRAAMKEDELTPQVINTISSFVAYGSPLARVAGAMPKAVPGAPKARPPAEKPGDILERVRSGALGAAGPLGAARQRTAAQDRRLGWRSLDREILPPGGLAARFRTANDIQAALQALLGMPRTAVVVVDGADRLVGGYVTRGGRGERADS
jgi:hypothetical protein